MIHDPLSSAKKGVLGLLANGSVLTDEHPWKVNGKPVDLRIDRRTIRSLVRMKMLDTPDHYTYTITALGREALKEALEEEAPGNG